MQLRLGGGADHPKTLTVKVHRGHMRTPGYKKNQRRMAIQAARLLCGYLGCGEYFYEVHHLDYSNAPVERMDELLPVCRKHHVMLEEAKNKAPRPGGTTLPGMEEYEA